MGPLAPQSVPFPALSRPFPPFPRPIPPSGGIGRAPNAILSLRAWETGGAPPTVLRAKNKEKKKTPTPSREQSFLRKGVYYTQGVWATAVLRPQCSAPKIKSFWGLPFPSLFLSRCIFTVFTPARPPPTPVKEWGGGRGKAAKTTPPRFLFFLKKIWGVRAEIRIKRRGTILKLYKPWPRCRSLCPLWRRKLGQGAIGGVCLTPMRMMANL